MTAEKIRTSIMAIRGRHRFSSSHRPTVEDIEFQALLVADRNTVTRTCLILLHLNTPTTGYGGGGGWLPMMLLSRIWKEKGIDPPVEHHGRIVELMRHWIQWGENGRRPVRRSGNRT